ncbi:hypothetical protein G9F71_008790 [Clostridium sp. FP2]|uniref:hypothetical protein n=1 Tax=Clostridium sp. FP2 TaxID=2724481 RepID=UPI0013E97C5E|nr:hypothetical protein [Clostridium sp. FP2]MBZ9622950.1 hypothetical protein [Clostridium sp. FP2]
MVIESKVLVGSSRVEGVVKDIEETTGSVLVEHLIIVDGKNKNVKQWYHENTVTEVANEEELNKIVAEISTTTKKSARRIDDALKKIELGVLPEKSDSDGE